MPDKKPNLKELTSSATKEMHKAISVLHFINCTASANSDELDVQGRMMFALETASELMDKALDDLCHIETIANS